MNEEEQVGVARTYRGFTHTLEQAYEKVKEITDQLSWLEPTAEQLDVFVGKRDLVMIRLDGYKYQYLVKIVI